MKEKWVYEALVKTDGDGIGLIAYTIYKRKKQQLAASLRHGGKSEIEIAEALKVFHDQVIASNSLDTYRDLSQQFWDKIFEEIEVEYSRRLSEELEQIDKEFENKLSEEKKLIFRKIEEYQLESRTTWERFRSFIFSGVPSAVATFIVICLFLGVTLLTVPPDERYKLVEAFVKEYVEPVSLPLPKSGK